MKHDYYSDFFFNPHDQNRAPFQFFGIVRLFQKKIPQRVSPSIFWCFATEWMCKNLKGAPVWSFGFFESLVLFLWVWYFEFLDTFMYFCYFWALDMAPTYAVPGLFALYGSKWYEWWIHICNISRFWTNFSISCHLAWIDMTWRRSLSWSWHCFRYRDDH